MKTRTWIVLGLCVSIGGWLSPVVRVAVAQELEAVSQPEQQALLEQAVTPFLQALQRGDVQRLEHLIGGKLALTLGKLLRENTQYPQYLRQRYGGTTVSEPIKVMHRPEVTGREAGAQERQQQVAVVHMATATGRDDTFLLHLEQDSQGAWKVIDKTRPR